MDWTEIPELEAMRTEARQQLAGAELGEWGIAASRLDPKWRPARWVASVWHLDDDYGLGLDACLLHVEMSRFRRLAHNRAQAWGRKRAE
jgi:hypothetical protein